jgi:phosphoserine phosphatase
LGDSGRDGAEQSGIEPESERRVADLLAVLDVSRQLAASPELQPLLEAIEQSALRVLDCERASVFLHDPSTDELSSRVATGVTEVRFPAGLGLAGAVFRRGESINVPDAYADPRFHSEIDRRTGFRTRSILTCPLVGWDGTTVGVLQALNKRGAAFDAWDEVLARTLSAQAGVAVQRQLLFEESARAEQFARELDIARQIQQALMPRQAPQVSGFDIAGWNRPADETGGDFFDFHELAEGRWAVTVADVCGHGIGPALVAAECRAFVRATLVHTCQPDQVLAQVNRLLCDGLPEDRFVTAFFALLTRDPSRLEYVSAGHGPILHLSGATGSFRELEPQDIPLGIRPGTRFGPPEAIEFAPGDLLAIVTDGFFEWPNPRGECYGLARLRDQVRRHRDQPAAAIIHTLHQGVLEFTAGAAQLDDLTAVVIKRQ